MTPGDLNPALIVAIVAPVLFLAVYLALSRHDEVERDRETGKSKLRSIRYKIRSEIRSTTICLLSLATSGVVGTELLTDERVRVEMGPVRIEAGRLAPTVPITLSEAAPWARTWQAQPVNVGNPHAVCFTDDIGILDLTRQPSWPVGEFPDGVNAEFVRIHDHDHVGMRVYERGVGETESCGTGTVAVAAATVARLGLDLGAEERIVRVDVPGGIVEVGLSRATGESAVLATLTGPAVLVFSGSIVIPDLA